MGDTLRQYQIDAIEAVRNRKVQRGIIAIPTGTGKGYIAGHLPEALKSKRTLYLAHRSELINQLAEHVERVIGWGQVGIEQAAQRAWSHSPAVIASVATIGTNGLKRLHRLGKFDAVVVDEAHHCTADTYLKIWQHFGLLDVNKQKVQNPAIPLIGLTATPSRGDNVGLNNVFDDILYQMSLKNAIEDGWLVPVYAYTVKTKTNLDNVHIRMGDYSERELAETVSTEDRNEIVLDACKQKAKGLKTLIFCVNVEHSRTMAEYLTNNGITARYISGNLSTFDRDRTFAWFARTPGAVLTNCQLVTEGIDIPSVECVVMARPTKSKTFYAQCLGRGMRLAKGARDYQHSLELGKSKLILLDITDSTNTVGRRAVNISDIFGAPLPMKPLDGDEMLEEIKEQQEIVDKARRGEFTGSDAIPVNLFAMPANLPRATMAWLDYGNMYRLTLASHGDISITTDALDRWSAMFYDENEKEERAIYRDCSNQEEIIKFVETWVKENCKDILRLVDNSAKWRFQEPTEKQILMCRRLHIMIPNGATRGQVSMAIDRRLNKRQKVSNH